MNCREIQTLKHPYADGELDAARSAELEEHLADCEACSRAVKNVRRLKAAVGAEGLYYKAPPGLERRIRAALPAAGEPKRASAPLFNWPWLRWGFSMAGTALAACVLTLTLLRTPGSDPLAQEVAASHVRSLMAGHLMDVASTDQHTVKPWFDGKVDFAPPVVDLAGQGYPLAGGRLDYLNGRPVAALIFQRQKHVINLFVWPASGERAVAEKTFTRNGYNLIHWDAAGMTCWAVSDLNQGELREFAGFFRAQASAGAK